MGQTWSSLARNLEGFNWPWVAQGFVNGVSLYAALPAVISMLSRRRVDSAVWRTAIAAGCFIGGYRLFIQLAKKLQLTFHGLEHFVSGALGCAVALSVDDHFLGSFLVIWWCLRAIRTILPRSDWAPVAAMCATASIINPAAFLHRDEHQKAYQNFMERMAFKMERRTLIIPQEVLPGPSLHGWDRLVYCDELQRDLGGHPTSSCLQSVLFFVLPRIVLMSVKLYAPLYLAWSFFKLRVPKLRSLAENVGRSTAFLSLYTVTQYLGVMWFTSTVSPNISRLQHAAFAWLSGLWVLLERKERRPELALYCTAHAVNSLYNLAKKKGYFSHTPKTISYFLLILASATLTLFHDQHPDFVQNVFGFEDKIIA